MRKRTRRALWVGLLWLLCGVSGWACPDAGFGVLVVAHGGGQTWNQLVITAAQEGVRECPLAVAFLMHPPQGYSLQEAITWLEGQGVRRAVVVPFLVSSYSEHFIELEYYLGLRAPPPAHVKGMPIQKSLVVELTPALDHDPLLANILLDYARTISQAPAAETLFLVAHGPNSDEDNQRWLAALDRIATHVRQDGGFRAVQALTLRDDAPASVRNAASATLRKYVQEASTQGRVLLVPVLISRGRIQTEIRERLEGLRFAMTDRAVAEHPTAAAWIRQQVFKKLTEASAAVAQAPGSVSGRVVDETGAAIPHATIRLVNVSGSYQRIVRSDAVGEFVLLSLPPDTYQLTVRAEGFAPAERALTLAAGAALELEVTLKVAAVIAETVVVTGTRTEHLQVDAPVRTALLTPQIIEHKEAVTLAEALTTTTGVRVETSCQNDNFTSVRLNGLEGVYTQILENGLPTFNNLSLVYGLEQIPTEMIERIEVVKGGASALYGANAVAGVINIIPRESMEHRIQVENKHGWHRGRPLNHVGVHGSIFRPKTNSPWAGTYFFNGIRAVAVDRDNDGFSDIGKRKGLSGGATLYRAVLADRGKLTLGGTVISEFRRGGDQLDRPPEETWATEQADVRRYNGLFRWNHTLGPRTVYTLAGSYVFLRRNSYYGSQMDPNAYGRTRNPLFTSDFLFSHQQGQHTLTTGLQFQRDHIRDSAPAYDRFWHQTFRNLGFYIQDEYQPASWVILVGGLRVDKHSELADPVLSPRANVRLRLAENWNLRAGVTTGFRAPVIFEEDLHITQVGGEGFVIENSPDLKEERSLSYTLALDYVRQVRDLPFQLGVNLYYTGLEDVHVLEEVPVPGGGYRHYLRLNRKGSYLRGVELDLDWRLTTALWLRAGTAFETARYREPEPDFGSLKYFRTPGAYGFLALLANLPRGWDFYTDLDFTGQMWVPHYAGFVPEDRLERSKAFQVWNLKISKKLRNPWSEAGEVKLFFGVDNLLDDYQPDLDQGRLRDAGYVYGPGRMRSFYTGLRVSF